MIYTNQVHDFDDYAILGPDVHQGYLYGWSDPISEFCRQNNLDDYITDFQHLSHIERTFVEAALKDPQYQTALDDHIQTVHTNANGQYLKWILSENEDVPDNIFMRNRMNHLYTKINKFRGSVYHSRKGLRITIPEDKWINWQTYSPRSQNDFTKVAWAQMTQFDKTAMFTALSDNKLGNKPIYISFEENAVHDEFWSNNIDAVRHYLIQIITNSRAYATYEPAVIRDLATTEPLQNSFDWENNPRPTSTILPYSGIYLNWDDNKKIWYKEDSSESISSMVISPDTQSQHSTEPDSPIPFHVSRRQKALRTRSAPELSDDEYVPSPSSDSNPSSALYERRMRRFHSFNSSSRE